MEAVKKAGMKDNEYQGVVKELEAVLGNEALNDWKVEEEAAHPCEAWQRDRKVKDGLLY